MVTEAGKELLRNTINTAKFHNRILEENEMWKQWEIERGLTMMVSDDVILSKSARKHHHQCSKHRSKTESANRERAVKVNRNASASSSSKDGFDRWDHNGFRELYPDDSDDSKTYKAKILKNNEKKWDHSGFLELYPEEALKQNQASTSKELKIKQKKKRRKHHSNVSSSDNEIWEEFKTYKRSKAGKKSKSYDSHVKEWKKQSERERKS